MFEIRIHGRGGQGVVTAAEMFSIAAFAEGKHSQAIPSFGSERMGAPVVAYVRIADAPVELYEPVMSPDLLIIQDPTLFHAVDVFSGLARDGFVLINTSREIEDLHIQEVRRLGSLFSATSARSWRRASTRSRWRPWCWTRTAGHSPPALRVQVRLLQGLRHVRHRVPLRCD